MNRSRFLSLPSAVVVAPSVNKCKTHILACAHTRVLPESFTFNLSLLAHTTTDHSFSPTYTHHRAHINVLLLSPFSFCCHKLQMNTFQAVAFCRIHTPFFSLVWQMWQQINLYHWGTRARIHAWGRCPNFPSFLLLPFPPHRTANTLFLTSIDFISHLLQSFLVTFPRFFHSLVPYRGIYL